MYRKIILSLVLPFCLLIILFLVIAETAVQALNVSGPITTDTTWTAVNSPYTLTGDVTIEPGVHLTIESNVDVLFEQGTTLNVNGHLQVDGTESNPVEFSPVINTLAYSAYAFDVSETGSVFIQHGIVSDLGQFPVYVHGIGNKNVVIENTLITYEEKYSMIVAADALHRLQMNNVTFDGQNAKNVIISFNNLGPISLTDDVILKPQPGLDGYLINESGGIPEGITMTLEAGTTMLFSDDYAPDWDFEINGHLQVNGTVTNPVTMTTIADTETVYLEINETGSVMMTHGVIKDMGRIPGINFPDIPIEIKGAGNKQIVLEDSLILNEEDYAVVIGADGLHRLQLNNVTFAGQNAKNVIVAFASLFLTQDVTLTSQPGLDGYLINEPGGVPAGITLTLEAGTVVQFDQHAAPFIITGTLVSNGSTQNPVQFTTGSIFGSQSDYWNGLEVNGGTVQFSHTTLQDALVGMSVEGGTVTAVCTQFRNNQTTGLYVPQFVSPAISITQSVFEGNGGGVWNEGDTAVSAINNWWGSATGPQTGTDVIGDVTVDPWLLWEPDCISSAHQTYLPLVIRP